MRTAEYAPRSPRYLLIRLHALLLLSRGANFLLEDNEGQSPLSLVHLWGYGEMRALWEEFLFKYYKLHVDLLVFGRAGPAQPRRLVAEFLAAWPTYEDY